jgi:hypothetical protein
MASVYYHNTTPEASYFIKKVSLFHSRLVKAPRWVASQIGEHV